MLEITAEGLDGCALFWSVVEVNYCLGEFGNIYLARACVPWKRCNCAFNHTKYAGAIVFVWGRKTQRATDNLKNQGDLFLKFFK